MADNVTTQTSTLATVPGSTVIATDDAGSAHYQKVKLVDGTADSTTVIPGDANGLQVVNVMHSAGWVANNNTSTAQTNTQLKAAPGASTALYITDVIMSTDTAMNIKIVDDTAGTPADIIGPFYFPANSGEAFHFITPIKIDDNTNVGYTSSAAGNHTVSIVGYTA